MSVKSLAGNPFPVQPNGHEAYLAKNIFNFSFKLLSFFLSRQTSEGRSDGEDRYRPFTIEAASQCRTQ